MTAELASAAVSAVATRVALREGAEPQFADWQASFTRHASSFDGFLSIEFIPAYAGAMLWQVVQRFTSHGALDAWMADAARAGLLAGLSPLRPAGVDDLVEEAAPDFHAVAAVTEVITTNVEPGRQADFLAWAESVQAVQARFPGYMGTLVQAPLSADLPYWTTLVRFATPEALDTWVNSPERGALLDKSDPHISRWHSHRLPAGFGEWFAPPGAGASPAAWKQTALVLMALFPVVMLEIRFLSPYLAGLPIAAATFIGNAISVSLVSWPLVGLVRACMKWWLQPAPEHRALIEGVGVLVLFAVYASELVLLSLLFP
ncbi:antibiotic biosynthesis monooxygenase [Ancylobacter pratisalsi]|uniref:Antibiotic biosynthesis monooxygenase n=1 Tax=Ancylobacter pratisalsi TaxID=1745854 RepID=A0A6P1YJE7_9HYPH|nr:antibiotic biosynthesis monooxygenase [Ancylobacter pratisalsi]QIB32826.1 antibiotic biosynthesis monooxygenase [Ancylobacter pratisalsi]